MVFEGNLNWLTATTSLWSLMFYVLKTHVSSIFFTHAQWTEIFTSKNIQGKRALVILWFGLPWWLRRGEKKNLPAMQETGVRCLSWKIPWRREWLPARILAWRILWIEEPGGLQSVGLQRVNTTEWLTRCPVVTVLWCTPSEFKPTAGQQLVVWLQLGVRQPVHISDSPLISTWALGNLPRYLRAYLFINIIKIIVYLSYRWSWKLNETCKLGNSNFLTSSFPTLEVVLGWKKSQQAVCCNIYILIQSESTVIHHKFLFWHSPK